VLGLPFDEGFEFDANPLGLIFVRLGRTDCAFWMANGYDRYESFFWDLVFWH
jgi:hypothetical protein